MNTILVDTTIWIDFFREKEKTKQADVLQQLIEEGNNISTKTVRLFDSLLCDT